MLRSSQGTGHKPSAIFRLLFALILVSGILANDPLRTASAAEGTLNGTPIRVIVYSDGSYAPYYNNVQQMYAGRAAGLFIVTGNTVWGPNVPAGQTVNQYTNQSAVTVTGDGTVSTPFKAVTTFDIPNVVRVTATVQVVNGSDSASFSYQFTPLGSVATLDRVYFAGDLYFQGNDFGYGYYNPANGAIGGRNVNNNGFELLEPVFPSISSAWQEAGYSEIWSRIGNSSSSPIRAGFNKADPTQPKELRNTSEASAVQGAFEPMAAGAGFNNTIVTTYIDNGAGLQYNGIATSGAVVTRLNFGNAALAVGDRPGLYNPDNAAFLLRNFLSSGGPNVTFTYGSGGADTVPLVGDWNSDGLSTQGIYIRSSGVFVLSNTLNGGPFAAFPFGPANQGYVPLVGDWNADGRDSVGVYNPANGTFFLINATASVAPDYAFRFGDGGLIPLIGDWNNDNFDTPGLYNPTNGVFILSNGYNAGPFTAFPYGPGGAGVFPVVGDWDGDGDDTIGIWVSSNGAWLLLNQNASVAPEISFQYGSGNLYTLVGRWQSVSSTSGVTTSQAEPQIAPTFAQ